VKQSVPSHWIKGSLLDLKRYGDGSYRAFLLGDGDNNPPAPSIEFESSFDAQQFVSQWYTKESVGGIHG
jgi:hypothetical protein